LTPDRHHQVIRRLHRQAGVGPTLEGHTEEEAFGWVNESREKLLPWAEECGVVLGLGSHCGTGRTDNGALCIVETIKSLRLRMTRTQATRSFLLCGAPFFLAAS
jgi:hypothetical protein